MNCSDNNREAFYERLGSFLTWMVFLGFLTALTNQVHLEARLRAG